MTVEQLIKTLSMFRPELPVLVDGYEDGLDDINSIDNVRVKPYSEPACYFGDYETTHHFDEDGRPAVYLSRYEH
jgi:hypothetical protein